MRSNARKSYQSGGYVSGDPYSARPGPDDVAPIDPFTAQSLARLAANQSTPNQPAPMAAPQRGRHPDIKIAPQPMSANAQKVMAQLMSQGTPNMGSAISKLANVWITGHNEKKRGKARQAAETTKREQRARWASELGSGVSPRDLAVADPDFLADTEFQQSWAGTAPAPEAETFEDVADPYGFGGHAQRSSTTGKLANYQGAPTQAREPARPTAKDQFGRLRYLDDESPAFSDETIGPGPTPEADVPPMKDQLAMTRQLSDDWQKTARPMQDLIAQVNRMDIGFRQAEAGDMLSGSQAILISFNKGSCLAEHLWMGHKARHDNE